MLFGDYVESLELTNETMSSGHNSCWPSSSAMIATPRRISLEPQLRVVTSSECLLPQYHIFTWVLAMIVLASFLKLNYIIKTAILLVMVVVYTTLMLATLPALFAEFQVCIAFFYVFGFF